MYAAKEVPRDNLYLFKSCVAGSLYPGIERSVRIVLDRLGISYVDDPAQSSCSGTGYHVGVIPLMANVALNARNLSLAAAAGGNIVCTCPTSYANLKDCRELINDDAGVRRAAMGAMRTIGREYDDRVTISHASETLMALLDKIVPLSASFKGLKAVTHHGCHYNKIFRKDVASGSVEYPTVLDDIAGALGLRACDYRDRWLCCGLGFHHTLTGSEYPAAILERKFRGIADAGPDVIVTQCPGCTFNLDYYQEAIAKKLGIRLGIPVLYVSELVALALGADPADIGLDMHAVPVEPFLEKAGLPYHR